MSNLAFLYRSELPHRAVTVYIYLHDRANKKGECWPAIPTIATELKLSQSTTILILNLVTNSEQDKKE